MARTLRLLTLSLAATATATAVAVGTTALASSATTSVASGPASFGAHEVVAPSPVPVVTRPPARPRTVAPAPVRTAPKPRPTAHRTHHAVATASPAPRATRTSTHLTAQQLLDRAVAELPNFRTGDAVFQLKPGLSSWGLSEMSSGMVYISPRVPADKMYSVVAHEWSHVLSVRPYDHDAMRAVAAMNAYFGGSGLLGAERAADCMARLLGATWTNYTSCTDAHWRAGARLLLSGKPL
jgi:hypothetical protein